MAKLTIELLGADEVKRNLAQTRDSLFAAARDGIRINTERLRVDVAKNLTGQHPFPVGVSRDLHPGGSPGTGLEVLRLGVRSGAINTRTTRMRSLLRSSVTLTGSKMSGGVGYSPAFTPKNVSTALANAINWPTKALVPGIELSLPSLPRSENQDFERNSPTQYIPDILLGSDKIVGRNVLRMALAVDIEQSRTLNSLTSRFRNVIRSGKG